jgi:hypothetical protein
MSKVVTIGDVFEVRRPGKDQFYAGDKDGAKCWPVRHGQGCYGDCMDCRSNWEERLERLELLPFDMLRITEISRTRFFEVDQTKEVSTGVMIARPQDQLKELAKQLKETKDSVDC